MSGACLVVMYHYVRDTAATSFPAIRALSPADFERQLDWLQREYTVVTPEALTAAAAAGAPLPPRSAALTFDDGFCDHHDVVLPILRRRGLAGFFFLAGDAMGAAPRMLSVHKTHFLLAALGADAFGRAVLQRAATTTAATRGGSVFGADQWEHPDERAIKNLLNYELPFAESERLLSGLFAEHIGDEAAFARALYLSDAQVAAMAGAGMHIGYHTRSHRMLSRLSAAEQRDELLDGIARVRAATGQQQVSFCYPWGGRGTYTPATLAILAEAGYSMAFTTVRRVARPGADPRYELPRLDTRDLPPHVADDRLHADT